ncbi:MAG: hypothetical protein ABIM74_04905 [candidate division WOR-3 bacterium]
MRRKIFIALIFLALFAAIHLAGDLVPVRLPFFGTSESVWEHLKMGWWSYGLAYGISWAITRKGSLAGLFTGTLLFVVYTYNAPPFDLFQEPPLP